MDSLKKNINTIDEYIDQFPDNVQQILRKIRHIIKEHAPLAEETISYQVPTFKLHGNLVHFAAYKNHIGFYPTPSGIDRFKLDLSDYALSKGTIRFPLNKPIPYELISTIVQFRVKEQMKEIKK